MKKLTLSPALLVAACALTALFQFCVQPPDYPDEPVIEFVSLSKSTMKQTPLGPDSILISFNFTDGDGNLGSVNGEETFLSKTAATVSTNRLIRYLYPAAGAGNGISGMISIVVPNTCCIYIDPSGVPLACDDVPCRLRHAHLPDLDQGPGGGKTTRSKRLRSD